MTEFKGILTCPECKKKHEVTVRDNVCMNMYQCDKCKTMLKAKKGCCVFCDYGDTQCPVAPHEE
jgi:hypothetical protein